MRHNRQLEQLWSSAPAPERESDPSSVESLPPVARSYLRHALAPGAKLSTCARLSMTGAIKLDPGWCEFEAEQVLRWDRGFVWAARAKVNRLPVTGFDRWVDGVGAMRWKLLGLFPVMRADGPDITRSAAGRLHTEAIWIPAALIGPGVTWSDRGPGCTVARIEEHGETSQLALEVDADGALRSCSIERWGDTNSGDFAYHPFGGTAADERTFEGITIPTRHSVGWHFGTPAFEGEGEFFRCTLGEVEYR